METNRLRILQFIILALLSSALAFTALGTLLGPQMRSAQPGTASAAPPDLGNTFMMILGGIGMFGCLIMGAIIRPTLLRKARAAWQARADNDAGSDAIWRFFQIRTIVTATFIELLTLLGAIAHLLTGAIPPLAAVGLGLVGLAWVFPTRSKVETFVRQVTS